MLSNLVNKKINLNGYSVFMYHLLNNTDKSSFFFDAQKKGLITDFDPVTMTRLRKMYYAFFSAIIYLYYEPTDFNNIANKLELLSHAFEDKKFRIVHGDTNSTKNISFYLYGVNHLDYNSWLEVDDGNKVWVYDLFSLLRFEKNTYYEIEQPTIRKIIDSDYINSHPGRIDTSYQNFSDGFIEILFNYMEEMEHNLDTHPFKGILIPEITRFKKDINYDELYLKSKLNYYR